MLEDNNTVLSSVYLIKLHSVLVNVTVTGLCSIEKHNKMYCPQTSGAEICSHKTMKQIKCIPP